MIRAVGFDLGDTLLFYEDIPLNWASLYPPALRAVAQACAILPTEGQLRAACDLLRRFNTRVHPRTNEVAAEDIFGPLLKSWSSDSEESVAKAVEAFFGFFQQRMRPFPETRKVIRALRNDGFGIGILTDVPYGMPLRFVQHDLFESGLTELVDVVVTSTCAGARKPETAGYFALMERLQVRSDEIVYVGNEPKDILGANRAEIASVFLVPTCIS